MKDNDMKPLDNELLDHALFPATLLSKKSMLESILNKNSLGIYAIAGDRGVGKTTLMNSLRRKYDNKVIDYLDYERKFAFLHLNIINKETDLLREIVLFLEKIYIEKKEISRLDEEKHKKADGLISYKDRIAELKESVLFDIFLEEIEENNNSSSNVTKFGLSFKSKVSLVGMFFSMFNMSSENTHLTDERVQNLKIKSSRQRKEDLLKEVISLFDAFSEKLSVVIILDELDKMSNSEIEKFMEENKILLTECSVIFFLLFDTKKFLDMKYSNSHLILNNVVREYIFLPRLNWQEFILVAPKVLKIDQIEELRKIFYLTKGNFRGIIKVRKDCDDLYRLSVNGGINEELSFFSNRSHHILISLLNTHYLKGLPEGFKEIAIDYMLDALEVHRINNYITEQELCEIDTLYNSSNVLLNSVLKKVKSIIIEYNDCLDHELANTLKEELVRYYPTQERFPEVKAYQPTILETTDLSVLFRIIDIYYDSIDGVIICKEETERTINNISYTANILISNDYMPSIMFLNKGGFAWNHEGAHKYKEMLEYLNKIKIKYIDIQLPANKTIIEEINNLVPMIDEFDKKYK